MKPPFHNLDDDRARENDGDDTDKDAYDHEPVNRQASQTGEGPGRIVRAHVHSFMHKYDDRTETWVVSCATTRQNGGRGAAPERHAACGEASRQAKEVPAAAESGG